MLGPSTTIRIRAGREAVWIAVRKLAQYTAAHTRNRPAIETVSYKSAFGRLIRIVSGLLGAMHGSFGGSHSGGTWL